MSKYRDVTGGYELPPPELFPDDYQKCAYCGMLYFKEDGNKIYCSDYCYREAHKKQMQVINRKNATPEHVREARENYRKYLKQERRKQYRTRYRRNKLIKSELVKLELQTFQIKNPRNPKPKFDYRTGGSYANWNKIDYVGDRLAEYRLYFNQIIDDMDKYKINYELEDRSRYIPREFLARYRKRHNLEPMEITDAVYRSGSFPPKNLAESSQEKESG